PVEEMSISDYEKLALREEALLFCNNKKLFSYDEQYKTFWKSICNNPPIYASDIPGSLFKTGVKWNLNNLPSLLDFLRVPIPGVTSSYMYIGMWKSLFCLHTEDMNLVCMLIDSNSTD